MSKPMTVSWMPKASGIWIKVIRWSISMVRTIPLGISSVALDGAWKNRSRLNFSDEDLNWSMSSSSFHLHLSFWLFFSFHQSCGSSFFKARKRFKNKGKSWVSSKFRRIQSHQKIRHCPWFILQMDDSGVFHGQMECCLWYFHPQLLLSGKNRWTITLCYSSILRA